MTNNLTIRPASAIDLDRLSVLYSQLSPDNTPLSRTAAESILTRLSLYEGSAILLGEIDESIVSTCTVIVIPNLTRGGAPYALIENVVTDADHRRSGYAKSLLNAATTQAWEQGCYKIMLLTGATETSTLGFYEGAGFEQSKTGFQKRRLPKRH